MVLNDTRPGLSESVVRDERRQPPTEQVSPKHSPRIVVLSNRGPLRRADKGWQRSSGGLVTALDPLLRERQGTWVSVGERLEDVGVRPELGYRERFVDLPREMEEAYYGAFSNGVLWPTMHGFPTIGELEDAPWDDYENVNRRFAEVALPEAEAGDIIWVHDYHLMRSPLQIRNSHPEVNIGWFCHIPWPDVDQFAVLPWRRALLEGVLGAGVVGFHSRRYATHFLDCAEAFVECRVNRETSTVTTEESRTKVVVAPIGIPISYVNEMAASDALSVRAEQLRRAVGGRRIVLGVDRLDYTKGIIEKLNAFARLLENDPKRVEELVLVQVLVPSRESVEAYAQLKRQIEQSVGEINGRFSRLGHVPVQYFYGSLEPADLYAHYRAADVALVTPLRDGMNLVALEYVATRSDGRGALVLSEFAGAAEHLSDAYLVNPYDTEAVAATLVRALDAPQNEASRRMQALRTAVNSLDVHAWADEFLSCLSKRHLLQ